MKKIIAIVALLVCSAEAMNHTAPCQKKPKAGVKLSCKYCQARQLKRDFMNCLRSAKSYLAAKSCEREARAIYKKIFGKAAPKHYFDGMIQKNKKHEEWVREWKKETQIDDDFIDAIFG